MRLEGVKGYELNKGHKYEIVNFINRNLHSIDIEMRKFLYHNRTQINSILREIGVTKLYSKEIRENEKNSDRQFEILNNMIIHKLIRKGNLKLSTVIEYARIFHCNKMHKSNINFIVACDGKYRFVIQNREGKKPLVTRISRYEEFDTTNIRSIDYSKDCDRRVFIESYL